MRGINLKKIADSMNNASGAEMKGVCTEAGMYALRERRVHITQEDFEMARSAQSATAPLTICCAKASLAAQLAVARLVAAC